MDMQNVAKLDISEGEVRTIHDKDGNLIWGKVNYSVKYKGNTAQAGTPTPDAPVEVQTVTGRNMVVRTGTKNLFNYNEIAGKTYSPAAASYTVASDGTVTLKDNTSTNGYARILGITLGELAPGLVVGKTYYLYLVGTNLHQNYMYVYGNGVQWNNGGAHTITQVDLDNEIVFYGGYNVTTTFKVMISEEHLTQFEPYQGQSYEVNLGKNLFDTAKIRNATVNGIRVTNNDGAISASGTATANADFGQTIPIAGSGIVVGETYTLSTNMILPTGTRISIMYYAGSSWRKDIVILSASDNVRSRTRTIDSVPADADGIRMILTITNGSTVDFSGLTIQLERGARATDYAKYFTPIELCKIGTYQDYIYKSGGKWYVEKNTAKIASYAGEAISTDYISTTGQLTTGATVYYALATPTDTEITNSALIAQLEAVEQWLTRYGYNATISGNLPIIIDRTAL